MMTKALIVALSLSAALGAVSVPAGHPGVACTEAELTRLKAAWAGVGSEHGVVAAVVARAEQAVARPVVFPPRGGQHNQWYQCEACQMGLKTLDDTHHQCPACGKIYTGEPFDDVIFSRKHGENLRNLEASAWAYAITGRREFAEFSARVLLGYADRYLKYPFHSNDRKQGPSGAHLFEQTLGEAWAMAMQIAPAWDLVRNSDALSPQDREAIRNGLLLPMLRTIDGNKAGKSNWQTWHNAAFIWGGAGVDDPAWIRKAIDDPENGFGFQMKVSVNADGMWYENSWGYHFYTLSALVAMAEGSRRLGIDLWSHPALRKMFMLPASYAMSDGSLPRFGDDVNTQAFGQWNLNECAWAAYRDEALAPMLSPSPTWQSVMFGRNPDRTRPPSPRCSEVFRAAGHAILRTRREGGLSAAMTFGPYGGFHGHLDKLSFVFFGLGRELGVDPGRAASQAYRLPIHRDWYKTTISHNAVIVDGVSQEPAEGSLEFFESDDAYAAVTASCNAAYNGVRHRRSLCMTGEYLLVIDDLSADRERRFEWLYHNRGDAVSCDAATREESPSREIVGLEYVRNLRGGSTDAPITVEFEVGNARTFLTLAAAPGTGVRIGDGVGASVADRVPVAMVTRRGAAVRYVAVIEPVPEGKSRTVTGVSLQPGGSDLRVAVARAGMQDFVTLQASGKVVVKLGS